MYKSLNKTNICQLAYPTNCNPRRPHFALLDRNCLQRKIGQLLPLTRQLGWGLRNEELFHASWNYFAGGCKDHARNLRSRIVQNTDFVSHIKDKRAACFFKLLRCNPKSISSSNNNSEWSYVPNEQAAEFVYQELMQCFRREPRRYTYKKQGVRRTSVTKDQFDALEREEHKVQQQLQFNTDPYIIEELVEKMTKLKRQMALYGARSYERRKIKTKQRRHKTGQKNADKNAKEKQCPDRQQEIDIGQETNQGQKSGAKSAQNMKTNNLKDMNKYVQSKRVFPTRTYSDTYLKQTSINDSYSKIDVEIPGVRHNEAAKPISQFNSSTKILENKMNKNPARTKASVWKVKYFPRRTGNIQEEREVSTIPYKENESVNSLELWLSREHDNIARVGKNTHKAKHKRNIKNEHSISNLTGSLSYIDSISSTGKSHENIRELDHSKPKNMKHKSAHKSEELSCDLSKSDSRVLENSLGSAIIASHSGLKVSNTDIEYCATYKPSKLSLPKEEVEKNPKDTIETDLDARNHLKRLSKFDDELMTPTEKRLSMSMTSMKIEPLIISELVAEYYRTHNMEMYFNKLYPGLWNLVKQTMHTHNETISRAHKAEPPLEPTQQRSSSRHIQPLKRKAETQAPMEQQSRCSLCEYLRRPPLDVYMQRMLQQRQQTDLRSYYFQWMKRESAKQQYGVDIVQAESPVQVHDATAELQLKLPAPGVGHSRSSKRALLLGCYRALQMCQRIVELRQQQRSTQLRCL